MTEAELALRAAKAIVEVAGLAYVGQAIVAVFAGAMREQNVIYRIFRVLTDPITRAARFLTPRFMPDRHMPWVAFGVLVWIWFFLILGIVYVRRAGG